MSVQLPGIPEIAFSAIRREFPNPPPIDDNPPLQAFTMSLGIIIGKMIAKQQLLTWDAGCAANVIVSQPDIKSIIALIWPESLTTPISTNENSDPR